MTRFRALTAAILALATVPLAACGFTPLYAETGVGSTLSRISVAAPDDRFGFVLRGQLEDALAYDSAQAPLWRMTLDTQHRRTPLGRRVDDTASRYELRVVVRYTLAPVSGEDAPIVDEVTAVTTYAVADQPYAGIAAQEDAEERLAAEAARLIRVSLSRLLASPAGV